MVGTPKIDSNQIRIAQAVLLLFQCACLYAVGRLTILSGFPLDDAWIHQVIARNIVESGHFGFAPGLFGSAATSLLWPALLTPPFALGIEWPVGFAFLLNALLYICCGQLVLRLLLISLQDTMPSLIAAMAFAGSGNFAWFAHSGMEALLVACLMIAACASWNLAAPARAAPVAAAMTILAIFTRTETGFLAPLIGCYLFVHYGKSSWRPLLVYLAIVAFGVIALLMMNMAMTGRALPPTLEGRRWMWLLVFQGANASDMAAVFALHWMDRLAEFTLGTDEPWWFWASFGVAMFGAAQLWMRGVAGLRLLLLSTFVHLAVYAVLLPTEGHGGRYQPLTPAVFALCLSAGLFAITRISLQQITRQHLPENSVASLVSFTLILPLSETTWAWGEFHQKAVKHVERTEVAMGKHLATLAATAHIASFDIGGIGYFSRRPLLDLGALSDPSVLSILKQGKTFEYLGKSGITHVVLPQNYDIARHDPWNYVEILRLERQVADGRLIQIREFVTPPAVWVPGVRATLHCSPKQVLYAITADPTRE